MKQAVISGLVYTSIYLARLNFSVAVGNIIGLQIATKCVSLGSARHMLSDSKWNHACISAMISMINTHLLSAFPAEFPEQNNMTY